MKTLLYHKPVLLEESITWLNIQPDGVYIDATFGGGGHSRAILERLSEKGKLIAFDMDPDAAANLPDDHRFHFFPWNFIHIPKALQALNIKKVDGILADLGVSLHQLKTAERGFSHQIPSAPLDMRMDYYHNALTAKQLLNQLKAPKLARLLKTYGEVPNAYRFAKAIVAYRTHRPLETTQDLLNAIAPLLPQRNKKRLLSQIYQALRIAVNQELENLKQLLLLSVQYLKPGGRIVMIAYHSLEDRLIKRFFATGSFDGIVKKDFYGNPILPLKRLTKKPIMPSEEEIRQNPQSRSARLRAAQRW